MQNKRNPNYHYYRSFVQAIVLPRIVAIFLKANGLSCVSIIVHCFWILKSQVSPIFMNKTASKFATLA